MIHFSSLKIDFSIKISPQPGSTRARKISDKEPVDGRLKTAGHIEANPGTAGKRAGKS